MTKHLVVILLELDAALLKECGLTTMQYEELPDRLAQALKRVAPKAIEPKAAYLMSVKEKERVEKVLQSHALDFNELILEYGDGTKPTKKTTCTVIRLDTYRRRKREAASED